MIAKTALKTCAFLGLLGLTLQAGSVGPTGYYYVADGTSIWTIHGATATEHAQANGGEYAVAIVDSTVRTMGTPNGPGTGTNGAEYDLGANWMGVNYPFPSNFNYDYDATSDGTSIYVNNFGSVSKYNADWTNPVSQFNATPNNTGITYDPTNNSLWVTNWNPGTVTDYALNGTILSSFTVVTNLPSALAFDAADDTLWMYEREIEPFTGTFYQYSRTGTLLQTAVYSNMAGRNVLGGEITDIGPSDAPEPSTLILASLACTGVLFGRRRRALL